MVVTNDSCPRRASSGPLKQESPCPRSSPKPGRPSCDRSGRPRWGGARRRTRPFREVAPRSQRLCEFRKERAIGLLDTASHVSVRTAVRLGGPSRAATRTPLGSEANVVANSGALLVNNEGGRKLARGAPGSESTSPAGFQRAACVAQSRFPGEVGQLPLDPSAPRPCAGTLRGKAGYISLLG